MGAEMGEDELFHLGEAAGADLEGNQQLVHVDIDG